jgi:hypothetical protein
MGMTGGGGWNLRGDGNLRTLGGNSSWRKGTCRMPGNGLKVGTGLEITGKLNRTTFNIGTSQIAVAVAVAMDTLLLITHGCPDSPVLNEKTH